MIQSDLDNKTNFSENEKITRDTLPLMLSSNEAKKIGISRSMFYQLANDQSNNFTMKIGERVFIHRDKFFDWMDRVTSCKGFY